MNREEIKRFAKSLYLSFGPVITIDLETLQKFVKNYLELEEKLEKLETTKTKGRPKR